jgi:hypothetical protein
MFSKISCFTHGRCRGGGQQGISLCWLFVKGGRIWGKAEKSEVHEILITVLKLYAKLRAIHNNCCELFKSYFVSKFSGWSLGDSPDGATELRC